MKKLPDFKKFFGRLFSYFIFWRKGKILWWKLFRLLCLALFLVLLCYYLISFFLVSEGEICLEKLRRSFLEEKICHETCASKRAENRSCLLDAVKNTRQQKDNKIEKTMENYIYNENMSVDFRIFLIGIFRSVYGTENPPLSLRDYLSKQKGNKSLQAAILRFFDFSRLESGSNPLDYYFSILKEDAAPELRLEAAVKIATYKGGEQYFSAQQLLIIETIIMAPETDKYLRQSLVLLLADYLPVLPEESKALLEKVYQGDFAGDNISRAFAADLLNQKEPEISQEEWDAYYKR